MGAIIRETKVYNRSQAGRERILREVNLLCERLIMQYDGFLNETDVAVAKTLTWGIMMPQEYKMRFFYRVLMNSYRVWDVSHERYPELLKAIAENNPEWLELTIKDHDDKLKRCKVRVFPLGEARTA